MNHHPDIIDELNDYLRGKLSPEDTSRVEDHLDNDPAYAEQLDLLKKERAVIAQGVKNKLKESARQKLAALPKEKKPKRAPIIGMTVLKAAAAIVVLIAVGLVWRYGSDSQDPQRLFAQYYKAPVPSFSRSVDGDDGQLFNSAMEAYADRDWTRALSGLLQLKNRGERRVSSDRIHLFEGAVLMELERTDQAASAWSEVSSASSYYEEAQWYRALALLKSEKIAEARSLLEKIAAENKFKNEEADKLLNKMK